VGSCEALLGIGTFALVKALSSFGQPPRDGRCLFCEGSAKITNVSYTAIGASKREGKRRFKIRDLLVGERCSQTVLDSLSRRM